MSTTNAVFIDAAVANFETLIVGLPANTVWFLLGGATDGQSTLHLGDGDMLVEGAVTEAGPGGFSASAELIVVTGNIASSITTASAAAKIGSATSAYTVGRDALFMVDNGSGSALYLFNAIDADAPVEASELTLLAVLTGTAATTTSDLLFGS